MAFHVGAKTPIFKGYLNLTEDVLRSTRGKNQKNNALLHY